ncbi:hypothetical protein EN766_02475 [Mesorhizobium sp. M2A.F.Ca.ET.046.02.1.1]|nr:hypothetical protein EN766_02475 [Mesorhizobium sp. M2A.F.Ca.ET.046.02.1.1]
MLSSLVLAPALLRQIPSAAKLGVVCADSTSFTEDLLGVDNPTDRARVAVGGIEGSKLLQDLCAFTVPQNDSKAPLPTLNVADIETEVAACVTRLRAAHPEIAALLFECTAFPIASAAIRRATKVPVYDITDVCRMALASVS